MKFTATAVSTIALLGAAVAQQTSGDITVNTPPSLVQCQPASVSWSGGSGPYIIAVIPGGQPTAAALKTISDSESGNSLTWTVDVPANTEVTIKLTDSKGAIQYSSPVTIQTGSDSCLNAASGSSSASGSSAPSSAANSTSPASSGSAASGAATAGSPSSASGAASGASKTTATATAPTSTVTGSASGSAAASGASGASRSSTPASSGASGSSAASASASSTGANSGALPNGIIAVPAVVFAALGAIAALF